MKKKFKVDLKGFFHKKENMAIMAVAAVFCAGLVITEVKAGDIPLHDGDVLVDSRNIAQAEEAKEPEKAQGQDSAQLQEEEPKEKEDTASEESEKGSVFSEKRAALDLKRAELIGTYDETIKNSTNDAEKKNAAANKEKLVKIMEQEISVENLISSKNLPGCLVIITENTATVTVDEQDLNQNTVAKICSIVMAETGFTADKIIIQSNY